MNNIKKLLIAFCFISSAQTYALNKTPIPVIAISNTDMAAMYNLDTGLTPLKVVLDCQSFLHGINLYQKNNTGEFKKVLDFYLYQPECIEIYQFVKKRADQNEESCIVLDTDNKSYELFESCQKAASHY
jgi:hypothetical protein